MGLKKNINPKWASKEELGAFVSQYEIRSARDYKQVLKSQHSLGLFLNLPMKADEVYGLKWSELLFQNKKFASYEGALAALSTLKVNSEPGFQMISDTNRAKYRLPKKMTFYKQFPGWRKLRASRLPTLSKLKEYCLIHKIDSKEKYAHFVVYGLGKTLGFPERPNRKYRGVWQGWSYLFGNAD